MARAARGESPSIPTVAEVEDELGGKVEPKVQIQTFVPEPVPEAVPEPESEAIPEPVLAPIPAPAPVTTFAKRGPKPKLRKANGSFSPFDGTLESLGRMMSGGRWQLMEMVVQSVKLYPKMAPLAEEWNSMKKFTQRETDIDQLAQAKGIEPHEVYECLSGFAMRTRKNIGTFMVAMRYPEVVESTLKASKSQRGFRDRELIHKAMGVTPDSGGPGVQILNQVAANAQVHLEEAGEMESHEKVMRGFADEDVPEGEVVEGEIESKE